MGKEEDISKIKNIIEALLMVAEGGISMDDLRKALNETDPGDIKKAVILLKEEYDELDRAFSLAEIAGRYSIVTKPEYMPWISNLYQKQIERLTGPSMETLAIVAYKQPVTRAEIESIRGVSVGGMIKALVDKELVEIRGRKETAGRPLMYGTSSKFLEILGLNSLDDLPVLSDFSEEDLDYGKENEHAIVETGVTDAEGEDGKTE